MLDSLIIGGVLPDSRLKRPVGIKFRGGVAWQPIFCANCGADGGLVPEENCNFAFYLCDPCHDKHGAVAGTMVMPDEVFWAKVQSAQIEKYGRVLSPDEQIEALKSTDSLLSKLAKDR